MKQKFEVEFYYLSNHPGHRETLSIIEEALRSPVDADIQFRIVDLQAGGAISPDNLPGVPCLRRALPKPERFILVPSITRDQVFTVLGLPRTRIAEDRDQLSSWAGLRSGPHTSK